MSIEKAVEQAITECIRGRDSERLPGEKRREAIRVSIYEYDEERHIRQEREDAWEEGRQEGRQEGEKIGLEKGRKEGEKSGLEKGRQEGQLESRKRIVKKYAETEKGPRGNCPADRRTGRGGS